MPTHFPIRRPHMGRSALPWALVEPHRAQARTNHGESLERLAEQGGLDWVDLWLVLSDQFLYPEPPITEEDARAHVLRLWAEHEDAHRR